MKLTDLQTFLDIVDAGGLTAAAGRRGVTQPALSRLLRDLEGRFQAQLLRRTGHGIELTPAGEELLRFSSETLERYEDVKKRIADQAKALPGQLRLSVPLRVGGLLIPDLYRAFSEQLPKTVLHVVEEPSERAREMLIEGRLDAAVTYRTNATTDKDVIPLFAEDLYAVGLDRNLGVTPATITLRDLATHPLLLPSGGKYRALIQSAFASAKLELNTIRQLETADGLLAFASEGEGVTILPMSNIFRELERTDIVARRIIEPVISRQIGVLFSAGLSKHTTSAVLGLIRNSMKGSMRRAAWRRSTLR